LASPAEVAAMRRAIAVSAAGLGGTSPNPPVGCVLLDAGGRIAGEGYHERKGEAHAEAQALAAAGPRARGGIAVVTLEPCNHHGRTPACRQALIDARVGRVVIAVTDPTSRGEGGTAALRAAGVDVETGLLESEARVVLGFWLTALEAGRPVITWPYVMAGLDAVMPGWEMEDMRLLRMNADAVLHPDGSVSEAVPAAHGAGILDLPRSVRGGSAREIASWLYQAGVRHLVLSGGLDVADAFLRAALIDRVLVYVPAGPASRQPGPGSLWPLLPPGFGITAVTRVSGFVRVDAGPDQQ
jgi:diaminohydroxyphosphoribosylaminopyrimidine deaminase / 5-amino-6-(5-phosphoribosylamino)uracil reductase